ncbi:hypothetical protein MTR_8g064130 [Medicago truncatula]|uniref:Uncharacterized protein n=1 Tax=Medicago truncatula TaxID=3880 RepID=A0A072TT14_MEDTR|nr:hypothetical protein MTR_8g064130 [Medicago truncatula]
MNKTLTLCYFSYRFGLPLPLRFRSGLARYVFRFSRFDSVITFFSFHDPVQALFLLAAQFRISLDLNVTLVPFLLVYGDEHCVHVLEILEKSFGKKNV